MQQELGRGDRRRRVRRLTVVLAGVFGLATVLGLAPAAQAAAAAPTVTGLSGYLGLVRGGTTLTVYGTGFASGAKVSFAGTAATGVVVQAGGRLTVTVPAHATGLADVQVKTPAGTSAAGAADRFRFIPAPTPPAAFRSVDGRSGFTVLLGTGKVLAVDGDTPAAALFDPATGHWTATGRPLFQHSGGIVTLLRDGTVLAAGGDVVSDVDGSYTPISASETYNPTTGRWSATGNMVIGRAAMAGVRLLDGRVLVTGGSIVTSERGTIYSESELYDPATRTWGDSVTGYGTSDPVATLLRDGRVVVVGGYVRPEGCSCGIDLPVRTAALFNPATNAWSGLPDLAGEHAGPAIGTLNDGRVLVAGGEQEQPGVPAEGYNEPDPLVEVLNPATLTWTTAQAPLPYPAGGSALLPDGRWLVAGQATLQILDPRTLTWKIARSSAVTPEHQATVLRDGRVMTGGDGSKEYAPNYS